MSKFKSMFFAFMFSFHIFSLHAQPVPDLCSKSALMFGFFNGVQNTMDQANESLRGFQGIYGNTAFGGYPVVYDLFYNDTEGFLDFVEVFEQRLLEHVWGSVNTHIVLAMQELENAAPLVADGNSGMFTAMLTWGGSGDVDLHVHEPDGTHVAWWSRHGNAGHLDVDNTLAHGPEHYYASCERDRLQTGIYDISLANFGGARDVVASVQISSWRDGLLGTRQVRMGRSTGNTPSVLLSRVRVEHNPLSGQYSVSIVE